MPQVPESCLLGFGHGWGCLELGLPGAWSGPNSFFMRVLAKIKEGFSECLGITHGRNINWTTTTTDLRVCQLLRRTWEVCLSSAVVLEAAEEVLEVSGEHECEPGPAVRGSIENNTEDI